MTGPTIAVLNGPNLNLLGKREPDIYGSETLADIEADLRALAVDEGVDLIFDQCNEEGSLVSLIQKAGQSAQGLILNAAAYTHTSVAVRDAVSAISVPTIEVHLSNIFAREDFRHKSYLSDISVGVITGFGTDSYRLALRAMLSMLARTS